MGRGRFLVLYGSETGQSQAIAEEIHERSPNSNLQSDIFCLSLTEKKFSLPKETCLVIVISTTGEGECPEKAMKFWRRLRKTTLPPDHLAHLNYALLALGDSNYSNFCRNGKNFDDRLKELGAKRFYPTGHADDAVGLEAVVEPWIEGLWKELQRVLDTSSERSLPARDAPPVACNGTVEEEKTVDGKSDGNLGAKLDRTRGENDRNRRMSDKDAARGVRSIPDSTDGPSDRIVSVTRDESAVSDNRGSPSPEIPRRIRSENSTGAIDSTGAKVATENPEEPSIASLTRSVAPLSESGLTLPVLPPPFLKMEYVPNIDVDVESLPVQGGASLPCSSSDIIMASIRRVTELTSQDSVKTALDVELEIPENSMSFLPGDSFSIVCPNDDVEVDELLARLGASEKADSPARFSISEGTRKRRPAVPDFFSPVTTLRHTLRTGCDIRALPKKAFLRTLVESTSDPAEKRRLQELCSKQGQSDYAAFLRRFNLSLMDVLRAFPSCRPPVERILEHVPRLRPRPYSISSSPLASPSRLHFVFNVVNIPAGDGRSLSRWGVCTGWLSRLATCSGQGLNSKQQITEHFIEKLEKLSLTPHHKVQIPIYSRINQHFHLPEDTSKPLILIGPGTGVAPFVGFLEHRCRLKKTLVADDDARNETAFGPVWLFFGCRHRDRDYLYREKLEGFLETGVLSRLFTSFSRDEPPGEDGRKSVPRYVQDNMRSHKEELAALVLERDAHVYVCGDARNMAKNVLDTWKDIFKEHAKMGDYEVLQLVAGLREEKRYLEDVWT